jgi:transcription termination/antitermination protein NusG
MADERNTHLDEASADDGRSFADDAVSNRSDDTALDEADVAVSQDIGWSHVGPAEDADAHSANGAEAAEQAGDEPSVEDEPSEEAADADDAAEAEDSASAPAAAAPKPPRIEVAPEPEEEIRMDWYILKVQSNRERSISEALQRKMKIEGLDRYFDQAIVPTEKVTEFKGGKKKVVERKLYPGYIVVHMHINDDTWFAVRETSGVGDFTGAGGKPTPMLPHEVARIIQTEEEETTEAPKLDIRFAAGDKVKVKEGNFESFEGEVGSIDEASGRVTVMINIFGRSTPVELEYWQIEAV